MDNNELNTIENQETKEKQPKKKKKWIVPVIIGVCVVLLIGIVSIVGIARAVKKNMSMMTGANKVVVVAAEKRDLSETISLKGNLSGDSVTNISSKAASEVKAVNIQVGDIVNKGDILCVLDSKSIEAELQKANVNLSNSEAIANNSVKQNQQNLNDAKVDQATALKNASDAIDEAKKQYSNIKAKYDETEANLKPEKDLLKTLEKKMNKAKEKYENASEEKKEDAKKKYEEALKAYQEQAAVVEGLEATLAELDESVTAASKAITEAEKNYEEIKTSTDRTIQSYQNVIDMEKYQVDDTSLSDTVKNLIEQLEDCTVKATVSGVVTAVNVSVGDFNQPGVALITIEDNDNKKLVVEVDEKDILKLNEGMSAVVTSDVLEDEVIEGSLKRVVRVKNQSTGGDMTGAVGGSGYMAEISVGKTDLLLGMSAKAKIMIKEAKDILAVPYDMVKTDDNGSTSILIAVDNGNGTYTAKKVNIKVGETIDYYVEVTGGDLQEGDLIIMDPMIEEGAEFEIMQDFEEMNMEEK